MQNSNLTAMAALKKMRQNNSASQTPPTQPVSKIPDHFLIIKFEDDK